MLGKLTVGVLWEKLPNAENIYIGRKNKNLKASPLACPYAVGMNHTRKSVCARYEIYLIGKLANKDPLVVAEMNRIMDYLIAGTNVNLQCYCTARGLQCHGENIKSIIDGYLLEYQASKED